MKFSIYQESRQGPRKSNQDRVAYCYSRDSLCMVIADGMGGHKAGEVASRLAVQAVVEFITATHGGRDQTWPFPFDPSHSVAANRIAVGHPR